ncbi:DNA adenine methylase, partial [Campylobacter lari]
MQMPLIASPLNYTGGKFKLLPQILPLFPKNINTFIDLFCGGCNVGLNVKSKKTIYNDINIKLYDLYNFFKKMDSENILKQIYKIIEKYDLSIVSKYGYEFYKCDSSKGLSKYNKNGYLK